MADNSGWEREKRQTGWETGKSKRKGKGKQADRIRERLAGERQVWQQGSWLHERARARLTGRRSPWQEVRKKEVKERKHASKWCLACSKRSNNVVTIFFLPGCGKICSFPRWSADLGWDEHFLFWTGLYFGAGRGQRRRRGADNITDTRQTGRDVHRAAGPWREKSARVGTGRVLPARSRAETAARLLPGFLGLQTVLNGSCHEISI